MTPFCARPRAPRLNASRELHRVGARMQLAADHGVAARRSAALRTLRKAEVCVAAGIAPSGGPDGSWRRSARGLTRLGSARLGSCRRVAPGPETKCDTFTHIACATLPYVSSRGHRRPRPTMEARPKGRERLVRHRHPHARCCTAARATQRPGRTRSQSGGSAAGASTAAAGAYLSLRLLLRHQKEGAQHLGFHRRGLAELGPANWLSETCDITETLPYA